MLRTKDRASSSEGSGNDSSSVPTRHWRVRALYTIRHVCCSSTIFLSNHQQREDSMKRSAVKYMGTPLWDELRNREEERTEWKGWCRTGSYRWSTNQIKNK